MSGSEHDKYNSQKRRAAVIDGCAERPDAGSERVCGVPRRERLEKTLVQKGYELVSDPAKADRVVPDCRVLVGGEEMHLCTDGRRLIEKRLLNGLRKDVDGVISRSMNRPISLSISRLLMNTAIKPNHVTLLIMLVGMSSGFVVAQGGYWYGIIGALLLNTQSVLDGTDGELARLRFQGSHFGQWFDTLSDDLSNLSFMVGATYSLSVGNYESIAYLGLAGVIAFIIAQGLVYYALVTVYKTGNLQHFEWDMAGGEGGLFSKLEFMVKRDFFCFAFVILAFLGELGIAILVCASAVGSILTFLMLARQLLRHGFTRPSFASAPALDASQSGTALATRDL